jgi:spore germination protein GerM
MMKVRIRKVFLAVAALALVLPASSCRKERTAAERLQLANKVTARAVNLYFLSAENLLVPEKRTVPLPEGDAAALTPIMQELLNGAKVPSLVRSLPADSTVRATFLLEDGTAVIDLGGPTLTEGWNTGSEQEMAAIYSVVQTVVDNVGSAKRVRLLVNGQPAETLAGHIAIDRSLTPLPFLLKR